MKIIYKCTCGRRVRPRIKPPPRTHEIAYYDFVRATFGDLPPLPEFGKKRRHLVRVTAKRHNWFIPWAAGTKHDLVPPPQTYPCPLCSLAEYNQLCSKQNDCLPYAYWATSTIAELSTNGKESIEEKFDIALANVNAGSRKRKRNREKEKKGRKNNAMQNMRLIRTIR